MRIPSFVIVALIAFLVLMNAKAGPQESFKASLLDALKGKNSEAMLSLTCLDGVSPEWRIMITAGNSYLFQEIEKNPNPEVSFTPFTGPAPAPTKYKEMLLVPNMTIVSVCKVAYSATGSAEFNLGEKSGRLLIVSLIPQKSK